jgi:hypothetical protein
MRFHLGELFQRRSAPACGQSDSLCRRHAITSKEHFNEVLAGHEARERQQRFVDGAELCDAEPDVGDSPPSTLLAPSEREKPDNLLNRCCVDARPTRLASRPGPAVEALAPSGGDIGDDPLTLSFDSAQFPEGSESGRQRKTEIDRGQWHLRRQRAEARERGRSASISYSCWPLTFRAAWMR